jgi:hypothetical protein
MPSGDSLRARVRGTYVRIRPGGLHRPTAPLDQRLMLRMPSVTAALRKAIFRLPLHSRLRQALVARIVRLAFSAFERGEYAVPMELFYAPDVEFHGGALGETPPGMAHDLRGQAHLARWIEGWHEGFAWIEYDVPELFDFGDGLVFTLHQVGEGRGSGARTELTTYSAVRVEGGLATWQCWYGDPAEALRAIGVDPASVPLAGGS